MCSEGPGEFTRICEAVGRCDSARVSAWPDRHLVLTLGAEVEPRQVLGAFHVYGVFLKNTQTRTHIKAALVNTLQALLVLL